MPSAIAVIVRGSNLQLARFKCCNFDFSRYSYKDLFIWISRISPETIVD